VAEIGRTKLPAIDQRQASPVGDWRTEFLGQVKG